MLYSRPLLICQMHPCRWLMRTANWKMTWRRGLQSAWVSHHGAALLMQHRMMRTSGTVFIRQRLSRCQAVHHHPPLARLQERCKTAQGHGCNARPTSCTRNQTGCAVIPMVRIARAGFDWNVLIGHARGILDGVVKTVNTEVVLDLLDV